MVAEKNTLYAKRIHGRGKALAMTPKKPRKTRHPSSKRNQTSDLRYPSLWQNPTADNALRILEQAVAVVGHGLAIADATQADYPLVYVNETFCALTGYTPEEVLGRNCRFLQGEATNPKHIAAVRKALKAGQSCTVILENYRKDGSLFWNELSLTPLRDETGKVTHFVGLQHDVTARLQAEQALLSAKADLERTTLELATTTLELERANAKYYYDALHDTLTGLANRALLTDRLEHVLERDKRQPGHFAVLFLDLDGFKPVNDSLGHDVGDELLITVAERLKTCVRPTDTVARLGGDEFALLLEDLSNPEEAMLIAERVQNCLAERFIINAHTIYVSASLGIATNRQNVEASKTKALVYKNASEMLRDADTAMYQAKKSGKNQSVLFVPEMRSPTGTLESDLRKALNKGELSLYYQPILSTSTLDLVAFEVMLRWHHPTRGEVLPHVFIPLAEESGLIVTLDRYALRESCKQVKAWQVQLGKPLALNVNVSGFQLFRQDLVPYLKTLLAETGFEAKYLRLELTESVMINLGQAVQKRLQELNELGIELYIDHVGKNYSALANLQELPSKTLKLDPSFTERMDKGLEGEELVRTIVVTAHNLGLGVVAEGIESERQLELVKTLNCEFVQGDFFSPPLTPRDVKRFIFEAEGIKRAGRETLLPNAQVKGNS
jgi:diguanylate cyclase (GGDEF)-like protein/PAS domain S-box-containing protein